MNSTESEMLVYKYLDAFNASSVLRSRVKEVLNTYATLLPGEELREIFISETMGDDGQQIYESLWLFFDHIWAEAHNFMVEDNYDMGRARDAYMEVVWWQQREFEPGEATSRSRLSVRYSLAGKSAGNLKASGTNCETLYRVLKDIFVPKIKDAPGYPVPVMEGEEAEVALPE